MKFDKLSYDYSLTENSFTRFEYNFSYEFTNDNKGNQKNIDFIANLEKSIDVILKPQEYSKEGESTISMTSSDVIEDKLTNNINYTSATLIKLGFYVKFKQGSTNSVFVTIFNKDKEENLLKIYDKLISLRFDSENEKIQEYKEQIKNIKQGINTTYNKEMINNFLQDKQS
jgi:hypothetical protein